VIGKSAWLALINRKTPTTELRSPAQTKLSRERGYCFADLRFALQLQLTILPPEPDEFVALGRRQAGIGTWELPIPTPLATVDLGDPVPNSLARGFELASQIGGITAGPDQIDHLPAELGGVCGTGLGHRTNTSRESVLGVHQTGAIPIPRIRRASSCWRRWVIERSFGWLGHWGGLHRERAGRLDVATGRLDCVASLMAANALNNPA
jgi:hypothetical protein